MKTIKNSYTEIYAGVIKIKNFFDKFDIKPLGFLFGVFLALGAAVFDGISTALLIPLARGMIKMDFSFVRGVPSLKSFFVVISSFSIPLNNVAIFVMLLGMFFFATLIKNIFQYISRLAVAFQVRKFSHNLRRSIFNRYLDFGKLFFDRSNVGHLNNVLLGFSSAIASRLIDLQGILVNLFTCVVYFIIMLWISWKLALLVIIILPFFIYSVKWIITKIQRASLIYSDQQGLMSKKTFNILSCIPLVKSYDMEEKEKKEFANISAAVAKIEFGMDKKYNLISPIHEMITVIGILLLISFMAFITFKGKSIDAAILLVYVYMLKRALAFFSSFSNINAILANIKGETREVLKVFDDRDKYFVIGKDKEFTGLKQGIEISRLYFSYIHGLNVLKDINMFIQKDKMTAIVGETGGGKTTLINLLMRFYDCPAGTINIDGTDIREFSSKSLRARMALVSQDTPLFNDTLKKNIIYGLNQDVGQERLLEVIKKARLYDYVMALPEGVETLIGDRGVKLSGGEKQRVAIARALLKGEEILILDEATSSLDSITERLIQEAINEMIKDKTVIVIAHRLSTIKNADNIVVIEKGRLIEEGSLTGLLERRAKFYKYWEMQKFY